MLATLLMRKNLVTLLLCCVVAASCDEPNGRRAVARKPDALHQESMEAPLPPSPAKEVWTDPKQEFGIRLSAAAKERTKHAVSYDPAYIRIKYPNGDVPSNVGVCSDEVIRAYRLLGIDLQRLVHLDMQKSFSAYPQLWGLLSPDSNIDHRRVPNLAKFFKRHGSSLPVSSDGMDYRPGDVVIWKLPDGRPHIGIVTDQMSSTGDRPMVMHNIGRGPQIEDMLFAFAIDGHFRYSGR